MSKFSLRQAYGEVLRELGAENSDIVALEADLGKSTMSCLFQDAYPERYFEMGIAEQDMLSTAAGLAAAGLIPFCSTFAAFVTGRAYDQIRQSICIGKLPVKIIGSSSGLSDSGDGATHQMLEDIALMSALPHMTVLTPADAEETRRCVRRAVEIDGPVYIRIDRGSFANLEVQRPDQEVEKPYLVRQGKDALILSYGAILHEALKAAEILETKNYSVAVCNLPALKPFDNAFVCDLAENYDQVFTAEDHNYIGGLAALTAMALRQSKTKLSFLAVEDDFGQSADTAEELYDFYGLSAEKIAKRVETVLKNSEV